MNENELFEAIGETDDKLLDECEKKKNAFGWVKWTAMAAAAAAICIAAAKFIPEDNIPVQQTTTSASESTSAVTENTSEPNVTRPSDTQTTTATSVTSDTTNSFIHLPNQTVTGIETSETTTTPATTSETTVPTTTSETTVPTTTSETTVPTTTSETTVPTTTSETTTTQTTPKITTSTTPNDVFVTDEGVIFPAFNDDTEAEAMVLAAAEYPEMPPYPNEELDYEIFDKQYDDWSSFRAEYHLKRPQDYKSSIKSFTQTSMDTYLVGNSSQNVLYSPINMYFSLGMFAEITDGNSRQQVLDCLGVKDIESLREYSKIMWESNYSDDGAITSIFANSFWLNNSLEYNEDTLGILSDNYYADAFSGEMGSAPYTKALRNWLNEHTGGMLENETENIYQNPATVISLASTVYFRGKWDWRFRKDLTEPKPFTTATGEEVICDYMYMSGEETYYWGEGYSAIAMSFSAYDNTKMWFILPDEGVTTDELIQNGTITDLTSKKYSEITDKKRLIVNRYIPKFDTSMSFDMIKGMKKMGINDVFDSSVSDYSPIADALSGISVSQANHSVRVAIDEDGCTATAFTVISSDGAAMPPDDEVDFVLNRPFIFVITGISNDPLFVGVINNPLL